MAMMAMLSCKVHCRTEESISLRTSNVPTVTTPIKMYEGPRSAMMELVMTASTSNTPT